MPASRNASPRTSTRLREFKSASSIQDEWQSSETIRHHNLKVEIKDEPFDIPYGSPASSFSSPSSYSPSTPSTPSDSAPSSAPSNTTRGTRRRGDPSHIPRPRNAFIIFRSAFTKRLLENSKERQNELSKSAAKAWSRMSPADKDQFYQQASHEKCLHQTMYPDYRFKPVRKTERRKRSPKKTTVKTEGSTSSYYDTSSESSSPASSLHSTLPGYAYDEFVPTFHIPDLEVSVVETDFGYSQDDWKDRVPSNFSGNHHRMPEQFSFEECRTDLQDPTLPLLPRSDSFALDELRYALPASTPGPSSLLCDNPYPSADYLASVPSNFDLSSYSNLFDGQHPHFIQPEDEPIKKLQLTPQEDVGHTFFNANGEYTFE